MQATVLYSNEESGTLLIKKDNKYLMGYTHLLHNNIPLDQCVDDLLEQEKEEECDLIFEENNGVLKLKDFHNLYQFNCSKSNENYLKLLCKFLERGDLLDQLNNPLKVKSKMVSNLNFKKCPTWQGKALFNYDLEGCGNMEGEISFIKYAFFKNLPMESFSLDQVVDLHIAFNKILAKICHDYGDKNMLSSDQWAIENKGLISVKFQEIL